MLCCARLFFHTVFLPHSFFSMDDMISQTNPGAHNATINPGGAPVITRFAPSPTGFLHIGGARTALFNWLFARKMGGKFRLRIEDTDKERSTKTAIEAILDGLAWLELDHDGEIVFQSQRQDRHAEVASSLLAAGKAYRCYASPAELEEMRERARLEKRPPRYDGRWRNRDPSEAPEGIKPVIRLKAPLDGETVIEDRVQGKITFANKELDDLILLRSDGSPTYMLAVVVDDHDMGITHIIRGDDHLTNAARQTQIYHAMGWGVPVMAHIPLIHGADGAKLSKRHGALGVDAYRAMGYLPMALRNYLVRLGWSHGDREFFSDVEMIAAFGLKAIGRAAARFDFAKLENVNFHFLRDMPVEILLPKLLETLPFIPQAQALQNALRDDATLLARLTQALPGIRERSKTLVELVEGTHWLYAKRPLTLDDKAKALLEKGGKTHLAALLPALEGLKFWIHADLEGAVRAYAETAHAKLGDVAQPIRVALTGRTTSPGVFDVLTVLGRQEALARLHDLVDD